MTIDQIQDQLEDGVKLDAKAQEDLWAEIKRLDQPMRASMVEAFIRRYPEFE